MARGTVHEGDARALLDAFDVIRVDCLNGDKRRTGKVAPDGSPDPSVFSTEGDPVGIQVGTAIATWFVERTTSRLQPSVSGTSGDKANGPS